MFGYPTGVGCLLVSERDALPALVRPWFAGGTVNFASVQGRAHFLSPREAGFEDGTLDYLGLPAVDDRPAPPRAVGIESIHTRSAASPTGCSPVARPSPPQRAADGPDPRPADVDDAGRHDHLQPATTRRPCWTTAGSRSWPERHLAADRLLLQPGRRRDRRGPDRGRHAAGSAAGADMTLPRFRSHAAPGRKSAGAIRVSLGLASNFADAEAFLGFVQGPRSDASGDGRGHVRHRALSGDARRQLTPELGNQLIGSFSHRVIR